jgi:hypothetical protein
MLGYYTPKMRRKLVANVLLKHDIFVINGDLTPLQLLFWRPGLDPCSDLLQLFSRELSKMGLIAGLRLDQQAAFRVAGSDDGSIGAAVHRPLIAGQV